MNREAPLFANKSFNISIKSANKRSYMSCSLSKRKCLFSGMPSCPKVYARPQPNLISVLCRSAEKFSRLENLWKFISRFTEIVLMYRLERTLVFSIKTIFCYRANSSATDTLSRIEFAL